MPIRSRLALSTGFRGAGSLQDAVVGLRGVGNIGRFQPRHVTRDAGVIGDGFLSSGFWLTAHGVGHRVTVQATFSVKANSLLRFWKPMRIMTADAAEPTLARDEAATLRDLLDLADGRRRSIGLDLRAFYERDPDVAQLIARAEVEFTSAVAGNPLDAMKVALITDALPLCGIELRGIDDWVGPIELVVQMPIDMPLCRSMTTLASDRCLRKGGQLLKPVRFILNRVHPTNVTGHAAIRNLPLESRVVFRLIPRRQIPPPAL